MFDALALRSWPIRHTGRRLSPLHLGHPATGGQTDETENNPTICESRLIILMYYLSILKSLKRKPDTEKSSQANPGKSKT